MGFDLAKSVNKDSMRNPATIDYFIEFAKKTRAM
jgi:hypothetical protein